MLYLVLDLRGTLGATGPATGQFLPRPHLGTLSATMQRLVDQGDRLTVFVWTSRTRANAMRFVEDIFDAGMAQRISMCFDRAHCSARAPGDRRPLKDLTRVWDAVGGGRCGPHNTLIVDDTPDKIPYSQRRCHYDIPTFKFPDAVPGGDVELLALAEHIEVLAERLA